MASYPPAPEGDVLESERHEDNWRSGDDPNLTGQLTDLQREEDAEARGLLPRGTIRLITSMREATGRPCVRVW